MMISLLKKVFRSHLFECICGIAVVLLVFAGAICALGYGIDFLSGLPEANSVHYNLIEGIKKESTDPEWHKHLSEVIKKRGYLRQSDYKELVDKHEQSKRQKMLDGFKQ